MNSTILQPTPTNLDQAARALQEGGLVAFPTETVYGLGASAIDRAAVRAVFTAKGRPENHPLIVHLGSQADPLEWSDASTRQRNDVSILAAEFWPGPLTLVLPRSPRVPDSVTGGQATVALRVPAHPVAQELLARTGFPLVAPSANRFGRVSPTTARHVLAELAGRVKYIIDGGPSQVGVESTILDLTGDDPRILRPGSVTAAQLSDALGRPVQQAGNRGSPRVSGSLASHYAPAVPARLVASGQLETALAETAGRVGVIALTQAPGGFGGQWLTLPSEPAGYARRLYAALRELDAGADVILVQEPPAAAGWEAIRDRLRRATHQSAVQAGQAHRHLPEQDDS